MRLEHVLAPARELLEAAVLHKLGPLNVRDDVVDVVGELGVQAGACQTFGMLPKVRVAVVQLPPHVVARERPTPPSAGFELSLEPNGTL
jgi:hypothetical protein